MFDKSYTDEAGVPRGVPAVVSVALQGDSRKVRDIVQGTQEILMCLAHHFELPESCYKGNR